MHQQFVGRVVGEGRAVFSMAFPSSDRSPYAAAGRTMEAVEVIRWAVLIQRLACLRSL